jgi:hypothetical protein
MRSVILAAGAFAVLGLSACDSKTDNTPLPIATKSMARPQQMYAGQEDIAKVDAASVKIGADGALEMQASGSAPSAGYTKLGFLKRINAAPPKDGVYELDAVADTPAAPGAQVMTPVEVKGAWPDYPKDHLKGIKVFSKTNSVVAMLPPG